MKYYRVKKEYDNVAMKRLSIGKGDGETSEKPLASCGT